MQGRAVEIETTIARGAFMQQLKLKMPM